MKRLTLLTTGSALILACAVTKVHAEDADKASKFVFKDNLFASVHLGNTEYDGGDGTTGFRGRMGLDLTSMVKVPDERITLAAEVHYSLYGQETNEYEVFFSKVEEKTSLSGIGLGGRVGFDVTDDIRVYGYTGFERLAAEYEVEIDGTSFSEEETDSSIELYYGFGARYKINEKFGAQAEYKSVDELSFMSIGVSFDY